MIEDPVAGETLTVEEPEGFTQVPDSLLLNTGVSDGAYRLYAVLKHHARQRTSAFPRRRTLARELGLKSPRSVDSRIAELIGAGYLVVRPRYRADGSQSANHYHLLFYPRPPQPGQGTAVTGDATDAIVEGAQKTARGPRATSRTGSVQKPARERSRRSSNTTTPPPVPPPPETSPSAAASGTGGGRVDETTTNWATAVIAALPAGLYPTTRTQHAQMVDVLAGHVDLVGHDPAALAARIAGTRPLPENITHPVGLLRARLSDLPPARTPKPAGPAWCGSCDERTRQLWDQDTDVVRRCPTCHPTRGEHR